MACGVYPIREGCFSWWVFPFPKQGGAGVGLKKKKWGTAVPPEYKLN